jgi:hypothetical protein
MCCDVESGCLIHSCGKREKPIDYRAIARAEKEDKGREEVEKQRVRTEKRRAAEAKRKLGDRKRGGRADARNTGRVDAATGN